jgi:hypothetical protein
MAFKTMVKVKVKFILTEEEVLKKKSLKEIIVLQ